MHAVISRVLSLVSRANVGGTTGKSSSGLHSGRFEDDLPSGERIDTGSVIERAMSHHFNASASRSPAGCLSGWHRRVLMTGATRSSATTTLSIRLGTSSSSPKAYDRSNLSFRGAVEHAKIDVTAPSAQDLANVKPEMPAPASASRVWLTARGRMNATTCSRDFILFASADGVRLLDRQHEDLFPSPKAPFHRAAARFVSITGGRLCS
jgi:hypothetical protein